jgi:hypothetical protein
MNVSHSTYKPGLKPVNRDNSNINFGAGKVKLWFDSDDTYFPHSDQGILSSENKKHPVFLKVKQAFESLNNFITRNKEDVELNVTTGRNRGEYRHYLDMVKKAGIIWIKPDRLVTKNGGDVFLSSSKLPEKEIVPDWPSARHIDHSKRDDIKEITGWDANYIKSSILETLEDWDFPIVYAPSGGSDYGAKSYKNIWDQVKSRYDNSWVALVRQDGDLNFYIGLPPNHAADKIQHSIVDSIREKLDSKSIKYDMTVRDSDWENSNGPSITINPLINGKPLDKTYDVRKAIIQAIKDNDFVIVAGNGSNDRTMLDPATYTDLCDIDKLPMLSIVVGDNPKLHQLADQYPDKFLKVGHFNLLDGVKQAIKKYSDTNPDFRKHLPHAIAEEIY